VDIRIRNVISRYYEDDQDSLDPTIDNLDFVEYLKKKNKDAIPDTTKGDSTYNPYDYHDPSSKAKDMGDSEVFVKDYPSYPSFGKKKVFDSEDPLGYWRRVRREDETVPPEEQAPAMSLDRKYASIGRVIDRFRNRIALPFFKLKSSMGDVDLGLEQLGYDSIKNLYEDLKAGRTIKTPNVADSYIHNDAREFRLEDVNEADKSRLLKYFEDILKHPRSKFISERPSPKLKYNDIKHEYEKAYETIKESSVHNVIAEFILSFIPPITLRDLDEANYLKTAATLNEIIAKHHHKNLTRDVLKAENVSVDWKKFNSRDGLKKGFVSFKARSADSNETHSVFFQFLKDDKQDVINPEGAKSYADLPVALSCSCESFLYYGAQWYALQGMYMYMPALRRSILPPVPEFRVSRKGLGKGLNFRVCKHILACYDVIKTWNVQTEFKRMIKYTPLSMIVNPKQWKQSFGIDFSYKAIMDFLKKPTPTPTAIKSFFKYKKETRDQRDALTALDEYFKSRWIRKSTSEKIQVLKAYINHPEEIFYFLMREAMARNGRINDRLAKEGVILIAKTIDPNYARLLISGDFDAVPGKVPIEEKEEKGAPKEKIKGMPLIKPVEEEEESPELYKTKKPSEVEPSSDRFETKKPVKEKGRFEGEKEPKIKKIESPLI
jgi:hypothetical protein